MAKVQNDEENCREFQPPE